VRSEIRIAVDKWEEFVLKGTMILEPGWTKFEEASTKNKVLPKLEKGESVNIDFQPVAKQTTPPKHYTIETLNNYLKNPFREEKSAAEAAKEEGGEENDREDYRAIFEGLELGTEATRTGIIDNARKSEYIALNKDVYTILPGGVFLIVNESDGEDEVSQKFEKIIDGMKTYTGKQIEEALMEAGFSNVRCDRHTSHPWLTVIAKK
jgi:DNA topoisomerase-3